MWTTTSPVDFSYLVAHAEYVYYGHAVNMHLPENFHDGIDEGFSLASEFLSSKFYFSKWEWFPPEMHQPDKFFKWEWFPPEMYQPELGAFHWLVSHWEEVWQATLASFA
jgi:hypothetical protein